MNCKNCDNPLFNEAKFCGKCGKSVLGNEAIENKKPLTVSQIIKKIFKIVAIILLVLSIGTMSSSYNAEGWLGTLHDIFTITIAITFITVLTKFWKNRKMHEEWFNWRWIIFLITLSILAFGTVVFIQALPIAREKAMQNPDLRTEYINNVVEVAKTKMSFPSKINDSTLFTDITAEKNAVRYHYLMSDVDTSNLSSESLKNSLIQSICQSESTKSIFDKNIDIEFLYSVKDSTQSYLVNFTKSDCQ
jgi:hypothetical protein